MSETCFVIYAEDHNVGRSATLQQSDRLTMGLQHEGAGVPLRDLLARAIHGDHAAIERLLLPHHRRLSLLCRAMLAHREDAADALQEVLVRIIERLPTFRGSGEFEAWVTRLAVNVCKDRLRSRSRDRANTVPLEAAEELADGMTAESARFTVDEALKQLSPIRRVILTLHEVDGCTAEQIAAALGLTRKSVYNSLYRARTDLARWADKAMRDEEKAP